MLYLLNAPFILDFAVTLVLFGLCFIMVAGAKLVVFSIKELFPKPKEQPKPKKSELTHKTRTKPKAVKPIRSIEINPDEIDRIYVKKIS